MPSDRTLAKRLERTRTWTTTTFNPRDGKWYQDSYNRALVVSKAEREAKLGRIKLKANRKETAHGQEKEADAPEDREAV